MTKIVFIALACVALAVPVSADLVQNGSFEFGTANPGSSYVTLYEGSTAITGWKVIGGVAVATDSIDYIGGYWQASNGSRSLDLNGSFGTGGVEQVIPTTPGNVYLVTFDMAGNPDNVPRFKTMEVSAIGSATPAGSFTFDVNGKTRSAMGWTTMQWTFVAGPGSTTTLRFLSTVTGANNAWGPALDNVRMELVPLPAAVLLGMLGLGAAGLKLRRFA
jgi:choice-of-anchor C domain-containing protein